mmetsp:Transcript_29592/g.70391  ORF Transcript_29592/g.70391 Transcript_29592/m.70391 type:complete len:267 (-) Transcript_29592:217-1017(-)
MWSSSASRDTGREREEFVELDERRRRREVGAVAPQEREDDVSVHETTRRLLTPQLSAEEVSLIINRRVVNGPPLDSPLKAYARSLVEHPPGLSVAQRRRREDDDDEYSQPKRRQIAIASTSQGSSGPLDVQIEEARSFEDGARAFSRQRADTAFSTSSTQAFSSGSSVSEMQSFPNKSSEITALERTLLQYGLPLKTVQDTQKVLDGARQAAAQAEAQAEERALGSHNSLGGRSDHNAEFEWEEGCVGPGDSTLFAPRGVGQRGGR